MYRLNDLITATLHEKSTKNISKLDQRLLEKEEQDAINSILKHESDFSTTPSIELAKTKDELFEYVNGFKAKDPIDVVFSSCLDWLVARRGMNSIASMQESYAVNSKFPIKEFIETAEFISKISTEDNVTLHNCNMDEIYNEIPQGINLGFDIIDEQTGGILNGEVAVFAARPGVGKTQIICHEAVRFAKMKKKVMVFSLEMGIKQLTHRLHGIIGGFNPMIFRLRDDASIKKRQELKSVVEAELDIIKELGGDIIWPKRQLLNMMQIEAEIKDNDPDIVLIDAVYLIPSTSGKMNKWEVLMEHSNKIKQIALDARDNEGIPFLITTQINRTGAIDPKLEDIALSDAIGQDADLAVSLTKPDGASSIVANIMKSRYGQSFGTAEIHIDWNRSAVTERKLTIKEDSIRIGSL